MFDGIIPHNKISRQSHSFATSTTMHFWTSSHSKVIIFSTFEDGAREGAGIAVEVGEG